MIYLFYVENDFEYKQTIDGIEYTTFFQKGQLRATHGPVIEGQDTRPEYLKSFPYIIVDKNSIPANDYAEQLYIEDDILYKDESWEKIVMPPALIKRKHIDKLKKEIDVLLEDPATAPIDIIKKQREIEKSASYPDPSWYPIALQNLDERVAKGEPDKPVIRQKLQAKIDALSIGTPDMNVGGGKNNANPK